LNPEFAIQEIHEGLAVALALEDRGRAPEAVTVSKILLANTKRQTELASDKPDWQAGLYQVAGP
jgi:hypothetical protein